MAEESTRVRGVYAVSKGERERYRKELRDIENDKSLSSEEQERRMNDVKRDHEYRVRRYGEEE